MYSPTQNNGQITQSVESISAQTVTYRYDALKRLISAAATPTGAGSPAPWTQTFGYDGYGNLTSKTLNGTTTSIPAKTLIDPKSGNQIATNQLANASYDLNGNMTSGAGLTLRYDEANRIAAATPVSGGTEYYNYDPSNHRVVRVPAPTALEPTPTPEWTFWGAHGERLGTFNVTTSYYGDGSFGYYYSVMTPVVWFAGKQVQAVNDRLGTPRIYGASTLPYGEANGSAYYSGGFATYWPDGFTGLHYAEQRYYASGYGRFNKPDPAYGSTDPNDPGSWNRYSYASDDPVNANDPQGLCDVVVGGITQNSSNAADVQSYASGTNAISVYPYSNSSNNSGLLNTISNIFGGALEVAIQRLDPQSSTYAAVTGLVLAAGQGSSINVTTFGGGAAALTAAVGFLNNLGSTGQSIVSKINSITYVAPGGAPGAPLYNNGNTTVIDGGGVLNTLAGFYTTVGYTGTTPHGPTFLHDTMNCGHAFGCLTDEFGGALTVGDPCSTAYVVNQPRKYFFAPTWTGSGWRQLDILTMSVGDLPYVTSTIHF